MKVKKQKAEFNIIIEASPWKRMRGLQPFLKTVASVTLTHLPAALRPAARRAEFTLLLTSNAAVQTLNHDYRGCNKPTNVLSFPHYTRARLIRAGKGKGALYIGDIAVAYHYTVDEARQESKIPGHHVAHLLIHGLLHLFGYDHVSEEAGVRMELLETKIMAKLGLPDPYAPVPAQKSKTISRKRN